MLNKDSKDTTPSKEGNKMKFLDNLFDSKTDNSSNDTTFDRTYIKLSDSADYSKLHLKETKRENSVSFSSINEDNKIFGLRTWIGLVLSFFFLCYVFSFRLVVVLPLLFSVLIIYSVMSYGNKHFNLYLKKIRSYVRSKIRKIKGKYEDSEEYNSEYKLIEI